MLVVLRSMVAVLDIEFMVFGYSLCAVSDTQKARTLEWKFEYYDMGGDGELSQAEEHVLRMELFHYVKCKSFFNHITDVIDADGNGRISAEEWYQFFEMEHTSAGM